MVVSTLSDMVRHHPWRTLRLEHPEWRVCVAAVLPDGARGLTRWEDKTIWLRSGMNQVTRRCVLEHERQHILRGPDVVLDDAEELLVEQATARTLISLGELVDVVRWTLHLHEAADALWVTSDVLACRIRHLHPAERSAVADAITHHVA